MKIQTGKVKDLGKDYKGWFIGHFVDKQTPFNSNAFEVKWIERKKGEVKENNTEEEVDQKTIVILVEGEMQFVFPNSGEEVTLSNKGEYLFYSPTPVHKSTAIKDSVVIVFRWPSKL